MERGFLVEKGENTKYNLGNTLPLKDMPLGTFIHCIGTNSRFDKPTLTTAREYSVDYPDEAYINEIGVNDLGEKIGYKTLKSMGPWSLEPRSGPVSSYWTPVGPWSLEVDENSETTLYDYANSTAGPTLDPEPKKVHAS